MVFKTDKNFGTKVAYTLLSGRRNFRANFALVAQNRFYGLKRKLCGRPHWGARRKVLKKVFIVLIVFSLFFVTEVTAEEKTKEYFYVNSVDGLRIRKDSNVESEKIGSLKNKERVEVISCSLIPVEIDGITSSWYEIKTEEGIQGFAFGGYLESDLENVEIIQAVEGD